VSPKLDQEILCAFGPNEENSKRFATAARDRCEGRRLSYRYIYGRLRMKILILSQLPNQDSPFGTFQDSRECLHSRHVKEEDTP
jgi:hypothetical protein